MTRRSACSHPPLVAAKPGGSSSPHVHPGVRGPRRRHTPRTSRYACPEYSQPVLDPSTVFDDSGPLEDRLSGELLRTVGARLGHRLPLAYVALAHRHNGGLSAHDAYPAPSRTTWAGSRP